MVFLPCIRGWQRNAYLSSLTPLLFQVKPVFEIDEKVKVAIILLGADSELTIKVSANVVRKDENGVALRFVSPLAMVVYFYCLSNA